MGWKLPPHTLEASVLLNFFLSLAPGWGWRPPKRWGGGGGTWLSVLSEKKRNRGKSETTPTIVLGV